MGDNTREEAREEAFRKYVGMPDDVPLIEENIKKYCKENCYSTCLGVHGQFRNLYHRKCSGPTLPPEKK